jgi:MFS superfamily sulfate permease-like transporter
MSLMHGLLPVTVQVLALAVLGVAISWRSRRWRVQRVPLALLVSVALTAVVYCTDTSDTGDGRSIPPL